MAETRPGRSRGAREPRAPAPASAPAPVPEPEDAPAPPRQGPVCTVAFCPICLAVTTVGDARPEVIEHLLAAGQELLLAIRSVIDARLDSMQEEPKRLERIRIE